MSVLMIVVFELYHNVQMSAVMVVVLIHPVIIFFFFFLLTRHPPSSPLFPSTPLSRSMDEPRASFLPPARRLPRKAPSHSLRPCRSSCPPPPARDGSPRSNPGPPAAPRKIPSLPRR